MEEWLLLLNPNAANGKALKKKNEVLEELSGAGIPFTLKVSASREEGIRVIHESLNSGYTKFIAVGGDGTLNSLVNGIFTQPLISPSEITVALIPIGTGNDWIKTHGVPKSIPKAVERIKNGETQLHDVGLVRKKRDNGTEERYFINVTGFAFAGFVAERIEGKSKWLKIGFAAFILGLFDALWKYKTTELTIDLNEENVKGKFFNLSVGICQYAGGGMKLTPEAITHDGFFDITLARNLTKWEVIKNVPRLFNGSFVNHPKISQFLTKNISVSSTPLVPIETDGEVFGYGNAEVMILPSAIRVVT